MIRSKNIYLFLILLLVLVLMKGCTWGDFHSIFRNVPHNNSVQYTDAKQRVIYSWEEDPNGKKFRRLCAEPSPDAFSAYAYSIGFKFSKEDKKGNLTASEAATQFSRIATMELIREWLYRACEAYYNKALDDDSYERVQATFLTTSTSLLAIDRLGASLMCCGEDTKPIIGHSITSQTSPTHINTNENNKIALRFADVIQNTSSHLSDQAAMKVAEEIKEIVRLSIEFNNELYSKASDNCNIKGNIGDKGKVYHLPDQHSYPRTDIDPNIGERYFCTEKKAQLAGFRPYCQDKDGKDIKRYIAFTVIKPGNKEEYISLENINDENLADYIKSKSNESENEDNSKVNQIVENIKTEAGYKPVFVPVNKSQYEYKDRIWTCEKPPVGYDDLTPK